MYSLRAFFLASLTEPTYIDGPLTLMPSATVFHYAQCVFEGLKAYRDVNGRVTLFRPDLNMQRMNRSANRLALPVRPRTLTYM